jgi:hypothetical protein
MFDIEAEYAKLQAEKEKLNEENKRLLAERNAALENKGVLAGALKALHKNPSTSKQVRDTLAKEGYKPLPRDQDDLEGEVKSTKEELEKIRFEMKMQQEYNRKIGINQRYGLMPDAETTDAVVTYAAENNIASYETAARFYKNEMLSTKKSPTDSSYKLFGDAFKDNGDIFGSGNMDEIASKLANEAAEIYKKTVQ